MNKVFYAKRILNSETPLEPTISIVKRRAWGYNKVHLHITGKAGKVWKIWSLIHIHAVHFHCTINNGMHIRARRDRLYTREYITDRNGFVATAVTLCFVPNQACSTVIDNLVYHAIHRITRPKVLFACYSRRLLGPTIADFVVALSFCSSCLQTVVCTKCETGFVV